MSARHFFILVLSLLAGCGFHLRGSLELPTGLAPIFVAEGQGGNDAAFTLRRTLTSNGLEVTETREAANTIITVHEERFSRQSGALTVDGKTQEYRLIYSATFSAQDAQGVELLTRQSITTERSQAYDATAVTGLSSEESQLRSEMAQDVVGQLLRRLQAAQRKAG